MTDDRILCIRNTKNYQRSFRIHKSLKQSCNIQNKHTKAGVFFCTNQKQSDSKIRYTILFTAALQTRHKPVLITFLVAIMAYTDVRNLMEKRFILLYNVRIHSITVGEIMTAETLGGIQSYCVCNPEAKSDESYSFLSPSHSVYDLSTWSDAIHN